MDLISALSIKAALFLFPVIVAFVLTYLLARRLLARRPLLAGWGIGVAILLVAYLTPAVSELFGYEPSRFGQDGQEAKYGLAVGALCSAVFILIFANIRWLQPRAGRAKARDSLNPFRQANAMQSMRAPSTSLEADAATSDELYRLALDEIESSAMDKATWARALAASDGDHQRAVSAYIRVRVAALALKADHEARAGEASPDLGRLGAARGTGRDRPGATGFDWGAAVGWFLGIWLILVIAGGILRFLESPEVSDGPPSVPQDHARRGLTYAEQVRLIKSRIEDGQVGSRAIPASQLQTLPTEVAGRVVNTTGAKTIESEQVWWPEIKDPSTDAVTLNIHIRNLLPGSLHGIVFELDSVRCAEARGMGRIFMLPVSPPLPYRGELVLNTDVPLPAEHPLRSGAVCGTITGVW
jgi:hypothetical protein